MNAAIWSRLTVPEGLYVVVDVPLASPEKYASAIWQKNPLPITSVNGSVIDWPEHVPVSARRRVEATVRLMISEMTIVTRIANLRLVFIASPLIRGGINKPGHQHGILAPFRHVESLDVVACARISTARAGSIHS